MKRLNREKIDAVEGPVDDGIAVLFAESSTMGLLCAALLKKQFFL